MGGQKTLISVIYGPDCTILVLYCSTGCTGVCMCVVQGSKWVRAAHIGGGSETDGWTSTILTSTYIDNIFTLFKERRHLLGETIMNMHLNWTRALNILTWIWMLICKTFFDRHSKVRWRDLNREPFQILWCIIDVTIGEPSDGSLTPLTRGEVAPEKTRCRELCQPQPQSAALLSRHCYSLHSYVTIHTATWTL